MARFFSKHEMAKFDKKFEEENFLNTDRYKTELKTAISKENHRINLDSAKKKAVLQGMNYDGFHQMVLGADLKGIKEGEITSIAGVNNSIMNNVIVQKNLNKGVEKLNNIFVVGENIDLSKDLNKLGISDDKNKSEEIEKFNQKDFIKEWKLINIRVNEAKKNENLENELKINSLAKLELILSYSLEDFNVMLDESKIPSDIFLDVINLFCESLNFYLKTLNLENFFSIIEYLRVFFGMKYFHSLKIFLGKKQKTSYIDLKNYLLSDDVAKKFPDEEIQEKKYQEFIIFLKKNFN